MRIVSLEDDEPFWDTLIDALVAAFPHAEIIWVRTEFEFCEKKQDFAENPPDIFLLDVMVKWADAAEIMPPPPREVKEQGYYRAGLRCRSRLLEDARTARIPVILFTVLERSDIERVIGQLPENTSFVGKSGDFQELIATINELVTPRAAGGKTRS
jgi:hypothetical protein